MHTHARKIVQRFVHKHLSLIHAARRELFCVAVCAVMGGHLLSLSRLARALMGQSNQKAALKRVDRLMVLTVSHFRRNLAAMKFVGGTQAQAGCDFGF